MQDQSFKYDVFLSHSSKDKSTVRELAKRLQDDGLKVWLDEWMIQPGDPISIKIEDGLEYSRVLILCMSQNAFESDWVSLERHTILFRDPNNKERRFIPLLLEECKIPLLLNQIAYLDWRDKSKEIYRKLFDLIYDKRSLNNPLIGEQIIIESPNGSMDSLEIIEKWHVITTMMKFEENGNNKNPKIIFKSSSQDSIEEQTISIDKNIVDALLKQANNAGIWNKSVSKALFELLIPNNFKQKIRHQNNILWKLDKKMASYPLEMFHDMEKDEYPTFVNTGLIRQLISDNYRKAPKIVGNKTALIIGDPNHSSSSLPQLEGARMEAKYISENLNKNGFQVRTLIGEKGVNNIKYILIDRYKILHIASNGRFNPDATNEYDKVGIALGDDIFLSPNTLNQNTVVPEFAFINCCHSGNMELDQAEYENNRRKLGANIGTQLIEMGVKAVVVAGWKVNDSDAIIFAKELYSALLLGYNFGESVKRARKECYSINPLSKTWAAYQCYGSPWYKLVTKNPSE